MNTQKNPSSILMVVVSLVIVSVLAAAFFIFFGKQSNTPVENENEDIFNLSDEEEMDNQVQVEDFEELEIEVKQEGQGEQAQSGDTVAVHYSGTLINGTEFDSSYSRGVPFEFTLGEGGVIAGWDEGVLGMKVGEIRELRIPSSKGYGSSGAGADIPPNAGLIFTVEMVEIK
jgi:FKBP-type peptidyl-prolyl cis-trans isomerase